MKSIRKRRRDRTLSRIATQKRLDAIAYKKINGNMTSSFDTWGASRCPDCHKSLPARAFICGGDIRMGSAIITVGTSVNSVYCHADVMRCASESAKQDKQAWMLSRMYEDSLFASCAKKHRDRVKAKKKENYEWRKNNEGKN